MSLRLSPIVGWFPFQIYKDSDYPATTILPRNLKLPLSSLTKAYWALKSCDYNFNVSGDFVQGSAVHPTFTSSGSGTLVVTPDLVPQLRQRQGYDQLPILCSNAPSTFVSTSFDSLNESNTSNIDLTWFTATGDPSNTIRPLITVDNDGVYNTALYFNALCAGGIYFDDIVLSTRPDIGVKAPITLDVTIDGIVKNLDLYINLTSAGAVPNISGTASLNFNNYYS